MTSENRGATSVRRLWTHAQASTTAVAGWVEKALWPRPWRDGSLRRFGWMLALLAGCLAGLAPFWNLKEGERRTITTQVPVQGLQREGLAFFCSAREAGVSEAITAAGEGWEIGAFDSNEQPGTSRHRVRVNGVLLPSGHAQHAAIIHEGDGRHSFWQGRTIEESGVYFSLPAHLEADAGALTVTVEWRFLRRGSERNWLWLAVAWAGAGIAGVLAWRLIGSAPVAAALVLLAAPWGAVVGVFVPELSGAGGEAIQRFAGSFVAGWCGAAIPIAFGLWLISLGTRRSGRAWFTERERWVGDWLLASTSVALFVLWIGSTWIAPTPVSDWTGDGPSSAAVGGRLPFSDAAAWYAGSRAVGSGAEVEWVARRPVHALLRAGELGLVDGRYQESLLLQTVLVGAATGALLVAFAHVVSWPAALVLLVGLVKFGGGFAGSFLSEASGFATACIGLGLALLGWRRDRWTWRLAGYGFFALAAAIRPGPMFMLLALPAAELLLNARARWRRAMIAAVTAGLVLSGTSLGFRLIASDGAVANANSANTVLGLSMGTSWFEATARFFAEDPSRSQLSTKDMTREMYAMAWREFRADPTPALRLLAANLRDGVSAMLGEATRRVTGAYLLLWNMAAFGLGRAVRRGERWPWFLGLMLVGLVASLPLIWNDGGWRGATLGMPVCFCLFAAALPRTGDSVTRDTEGGLPWALSGIGTVVVALILFGAGQHAFGLKTQPGEPAAVVVRGTHDAVLNVADHPQPAQALGPLAVRPADLLSILHQTGLSVYSLDETLAALQPPFVIAVVVPDRAKPERSVWMVFPGLTIERGTVVRVERYTELADGYVARADRWTLLK